MSTESDPRISFLIALSRTLHQYGIPAHRLEEALGNAAARLGIRAEFFTGPTAVFSAFGEPGNQHTALSRVQQGAVQLDKLVELNDVVESLYRGELELSEAQRRLQTVETAPPRYGHLLTTFAFAATSGLASRILGGGAPEMAVSVALGLATGLVARLADRFVAVGRIFEFLVATVVTFLALAISAFLLPASTGPVIVASLIILLPGLSLTLALNELATGHLVSGTARLTGAMMSFLKIGLGVGIGRKLAEFLPGQIPDVAPGVLPLWTLWLALVITPFALAVLFRARLKDAPWMVLGALVAFWGTRAGVDLLGPGLGAVVGAFLAGVVGNGYARWQRKPSAVLIVPSLILLVPGTIGYHGLSLLMERDILSGVDSAFTALLVGVSLVAGLLLANVLVPARNAL